jgi:AbrB family looped-hinge helix DNA binding protein
MSIDGFVMESLTISPKFQVVIPKSIRDSLNLMPGQKIQAVLYDNRVELIPILPMKRMRGFLKGIDTAIERDRDRV